MSQLDHRVAGLRARTSARVRTGREAAGFSQEDTATHLRMSTSAYRAKERGTSAFSVEQIHLLELFFCLEEADLYRAEGPLRVQPRRISDGAGARP